MFQLIFWGVAAAAVIGGFWAFVHSHDAGVRNEQIAADKVVLDRVKMERDNSRLAEQQREAETQACIATAAAQSDAIGLLGKRTEAALADSRRIAEESRKREAASKGERTRLQTIVDAPPLKDQSCVDELAKTKAILQTASKTKGAK